MRRWLKLDCRIPDFSEELSQIWLDSNPGSLLISVSWRRSVPFLILLQPLMMSALVRLFSVPRSPFHECNRKEFSPTNHGRSSRGIALDG
jgi:hypothetical protein